MKVNSLKRTVSQRNHTEKSTAKNILELVGNTPLVKLKKISKKGASVLAKLESMNPSGSLKDRVALKIVEDAEKKGLLKKGFTIVEATTGNMGISLAMVATVKNYPLVLVAPETLSLERRNLLEALGAKIMHTPASDGMRGAVKKAKSLAQRNTSNYWPDSFSNPANPLAHAQTTAEEIIGATKGNFDVLVAGVGTGGTLTGIGSSLRRINPDLKIVAVEPAASSVLSGEKPGLHHIIGIGAGFIPKVLDLKLIDEIVTVSDEDAYSATKNLLKEEGLLVGISSGAAAFAALKVASKLRADDVIVVIFADRGERYFETLLLF